MASTGWSTLGHNIQHVIIYMLQSLEWDLAFVLLKVTVILKDWCIVFHTYGKEDWTVSNGNKTIPFWTLSCHRNSLHWDKYGDAQYYCMVQTPACYSYETYYWNVSAQTRDGQCFVIDNMEYCCQYMFKHASISILAVTWNNKSHSNFGSMLGYLPGSDLTAICKLSMVNILSILMKWWQIMAL